MKTGLFKSLSNPARSTKQVDSGEHRSFECLRKLLSHFLHCRASATQVKPAQIPAAVDFPLRGAEPHLDSTTNSKQKANIFYSAVFRAMARRPWGHANAVLVHSVTGVDTLRWAVGESAQGAGREGGYDMRLGHSVSRCWPHELWKRWRSAAARYDPTPDWGHRVAVPGLPPAQHARCFLPRECSRSRGAR